MLRDIHGDRLFRKVEVRIVFPNNVLPEQHLRQCAGPHQGFGPTGIDDILMRIADQLEQLYPWWQFRPVELAPVGRTARYVIMFDSYRKTDVPEVKIEQFQNSIPTTTKSNASEPGAAGSLAPIEVGNSLQ